MSRLPRILEKYFQEHYRPCLAAMKYYPLNDTSFYKSVAGFLFKAYKTFSSLLKLDLTKVCWQIKCLNVLNYFQRSQVSNRFLGNLALKPNLNEVPHYSRMYSSLATFLNYTFYFYRHGIITYCGLQNLYQLLCKHIAHPSYMYYTSEKKWRLFTSAICEHQVWVTTSRNA